MNKQTNKPKSEDAVIVIEKRGDTYHVVVVPTKHDKKRIS